MTQNVSPYAPNFVPAIEIDRIFTFAEEIARSMGIFFQLGVSMKFGTTHITLAKWVGDVPTDVVSRAPVFVLKKLADVMGVELVASADRSVCLVGPREFEFEGAIRGVDGYGLDLAIAVSKLDQFHDRMIAGILYYQFKFQAGGTFPLMLHHVGFPMDRSKYAQFLHDLGDRAIVVHAKDHDRFYWHSGHSSYFYEAQCWPAPSDGVLHWDFVARDPKHFLVFLENVVAQMPEFWDGTDKDPVGGVYVPAKVGIIQYAVMARATWWNVLEEKPT